MQTVGCVQAEKNRIPAAATHPPSNRRNRAYPVPHQPTTSSSVPKSTHKLGTRRSAPKSRARETRPGNPSPRTNLPVREGRLTPLKHHPGNLHSGHPSLQRNRNVVVVKLGFVLGRSTLGRSLSHSHAALCGFGDDHGDETRRRTYGKQSPLSVMILPSTGPILPPSLAQSRPRPILPQSRLSTHQTYSPSSPEPCQQPRPSWHSDRCT